MDRDAIVFAVCMLLGAAALLIDGCSSYPQLPEPKSQAERCADYEAGARWIREQGSPLNVGSEQALEANAREARKAGCQ